MWVAYTDGSIGKVFFRQLPYLGDIEWEFYNTIVGPFNPNIYAPPQLECGPAPMAAAAKIMRPMNIVRNLLTLLSRVN